MLVAGVAAWRVWRAEGGPARPWWPGIRWASIPRWWRRRADLAQAAPLVRLRAAAMQEAVPVGAGAMAAILGLEASAG
jgi:[acyl-carrier-protein] S-malonyltransferase